jgi:hypothetical protein
VQHVKLRNLTHPHKNYNPFAICTRSVGW